MSPPLITKDVAGVISDDQDSIINVGRLRLAKILVKQERATLLWMGVVDVHRLPNFELPMKELMRQEIVKLALQSYQNGRKSISDISNGRESGRVRAKALVATDRLINSIEDELKTGWASLATTKQDKKWWRYHTKKTFAELGGWDAPDGI